MLHLKSVKNFRAVSTKQRRRIKNRKFYSLHDKVCRMDVLKEAWKKVRGESWRIRRR